MSRTALLIAVAAIAVAGCGREENENPYVASNTDDTHAPAAQQVNTAAPAGLPAGVKVARKEPYGDYLADASGRSLYVLEGARQSGQGAGGRTCTGECLGQWPAFSGGGAGGQSQTVEGGAPVSFAGWPLHYYVGDHNPGSTAGQAYRDRWGEWYLLSPQGTPIQGRETGPAAQ